MSRDKGLAVWVGFGCGFSSCRLGVGSGAGGGSGCLTSGCDSTACSRMGSSRLSSRGRPSGWLGLLEVSTGWVRRGLGTLSFIARIALGAGTLLCAAFRSPPAALFWLFPLVLALWRSPAPCGRPQAHASSSVQISRLVSPLFCFFCFLVVRFFLPFTAIVHLLESRYTPTSTAPRPNPATPTPTPVTAVSRAGWLTSWKADLISTVKR